MKNQSNRTFAPHLVVTIILLVFVTAGAYNASQCDGNWVFALDDSYIHLAMARNVAEHGVWGATPDQFSATSSAPIYTILLAAAFLAGLGGEAIAWILSAVGGVLVAYLLTRRICEFFPKLMVATVLGLFCCVCIWLPEIMTMGMEHTLHISGVLIVILLLERLLSDAPSKRNALWLAIAVFVTAGLRYETMFLLPPICWLLWQSGRRQVAIAVLGCGILPAVTLGFFQLAYGAMFFPNSVLVKGVDIDGGIVGHLQRLFHQLDSSPRIALLAIAAIQLFEIARRKEKQPLGLSAPSLVFIFAMVAHAAFARPDRRYLGYLFALGFWAAMPALSRWYAQGRKWLEESRASAHYSSMRALFVLVLVIGLLPFVPQVMELERLSRLGQDIYAQQAQTARFLSTYYPDQTVGLNDIGTTAWAGKNKILDLWGLADNEVAKLRLSGGYGPKEMERLARERNVKVVAIYSNWFLREKGLPEQWKLVARWQFPLERHVNVASNAVDFFATSPAAFDELLRNMQAFSPQLPAYVTIIK